MEQTIEDFSEAAESWETINYRNVLGHDGNDNDVYPRSILTHKEKTINESSEKIETLDKLADDIYTQTKIYEGDDQSLIPNSISKITTVFAFNGDDLSTNSTQSVSISTGKVIRNSSSLELSSDTINRKMIFTSECKTRYSEGPEIDKFPIKQSERETKYPLGRDRSFEETYDDTKRSEKITPAYEATHPKVAFFGVTSECEYTRPYFSYVRNDVRSNFNQVLSETGISSVTIPRDSYTAAQADDDGSGQYCEVCLKQMNKSKNCCQKTKTRVRLQVESEKDIADQKDDELNGDRILNRDTDHAPPSVERINSLTTTNIFRHSQHSRYRNQGFGVFADVTPTISSLSLLTTRTSSCSLLKDDSDLSFDGPLCEICRQELKAKRKRHEKKITFSTREEDNVPLVQLRCTDVESPPRNMCMKTTACLKDLSDPMMYYLLITPRIPTNMQEFRIMNIDHSDTGGTKHSATANRDHLAGGADDCVCTRNKKDKTSGSESVCSCVQKVQAQIGKAGSQKAPPNVQENKETSVTPSQDPQKNAPPPTQDTEHPTSGVGEVPATCANPCVPCGCNDEGEDPNLCYLINQHRPVNASSVRSDAPATGGGVPTSPAPVRSDAPATGGGVSSSPAPVCPSPIPTPRKGPSPCPSTQKLSGTGPQGDHRNNKCKVPSICSVCNGQIIPECTCEMLQGQLGKSGGMKLPDPPNQKPSQPIEPPVEIVLQAPEQFREDVPSAQAHVKGSNASKSPAATHEGCECLLLHKVCGCDTSDDPCPCERVESCTCGDTCSCTVDDPSRGGGTGMEGVEASKHSTGSNLPSVGGPSGYEASRETAGVSMKAGSPSSFSGKPRDHGDGEASGECSEKCRPCRCEEDDTDEPYLCNLIKVLKQNTAFHNPPTVSASAQTGPSASTHAPPATDTSIRGPPSRERLPPCGDGKPPCGSCSSERYDECICPPQLPGINAPEPEICGEETPVPPQCEKEVLDDCVCRGTAVPVKVEKNPESQPRMGSPRERLPPCGDGNPPCGSCSSERYDECICPPELPGPNPVAPEICGEEPQEKHRCELETFPNCICFAQTNGKLGASTHMATHSLGASKDVLSSKADKQTPLASQINTANPPCGDGKPPCETCSSERLDECTCPPELPGGAPIEICGEEDNKAQSPKPSTGIGQTKAGGDECAEKCSPCSCFYEDDEPILCYVVNAGKEGKNKDAGPTGSQSVPDQSNLGRHESAKSAPAVLSQQDKSQTDFCKINALCSFCKEQLQAECDCEEITKGQMGSLAKEQSTQTPDHVTKTPAPPPVTITKPQDERAVVADGKESIPECTCDNAGSKVGGEGSPPAQPPSSSPENTKEDPTKSSPEAQAPKVSDAHAAAGDTTEINVSAQCGDPCHFCVCFDESDVPVLCYLINVGQGRNNERSMAANAPPMDGESKPPPTVQQPSRQGTVDSITCPCGTDCPCERLVKEYIEKNKIGATRVTIPPPVKFEDKTDENVTTEKAHSIHLDPKPPTPPMGADRGTNPGHNRMNMPSTASGKGPVKPLDCGGPTCSGSCKTGELRLVGGCEEISSCTTVGAGMSRGNLSGVSNNAVAENNRRENDTKDAQHQPSVPEFGSDPCECLAIVRQFIAQHSQNPDKLCGKDGFYCTSEQAKSMEQCICPDEKVTEPLCDVCRNEVSREPGIKTHPQVTTTQSAPAAVTVPSSTRPVPAPCLETIILDCTCRPTKSSKTIQSNVMGRSSEGYQKGESKSCKCMTGNECNCSKVAKSFISQKSAPGMQISQPSGMSRDKGKEFAVQSKASGVRSKIPPIDGSVPTDSPEFCETGILLCKTCASGRVKECNITETVSFGREKEVSKPQTPTPGQIPGVCGGVNSPCEDVCNKEKLPDCTCEQNFPVYESTIGDAGQPGHPRDHSPSKDPLANKVEKLETVGDTRLQEKRPANETCGYGQPPCEVCDTQRYEDCTCPPGLPNMPAAEIQICNGETAPPPKNENVAFSSKVCGYGEPPCGVCDTERYEDCTCPPALPNTPAGEIQICDEETTPAPKTKTELSSHVCGYGEPPCGVCESKRYEDCTCPPAQTTKVATEICGEEDTGKPTSQAQLSPSSQPQLQSQPPHKKRGDESDDEYCLCPEIPEEVLRKIIAKNQILDAESLTRICGCINDGTFHDSFVTEIKHADKGTRLSRERVCIKVRRVCDCTNKAGLPAMSDVRRPMPFSTSSKSAKLDESGTHPSDQPEKVLKVTSEVAGSGSGTQQPQCLGPGPGGVCLTKSVPTISTTSSSTSPRSSSHKEPSGRSSQKRQGRARGKRTGTNGTSGGSATGGGGGGGGSSARSSPIGSTPSNLQTTIYSLVGKCELKDKMIECLLQELTRQGNTRHVYQEMLECIANRSTPCPQPAKDYTRVDVCRALPRPDAAYMVCRALGAARQADAAAAAALTCVCPGGRGPAHGALHSSPDATGAVEADAEADDSRERPDTATRSVRSAQSTRSGKSTRSDDAGDAMVNTRADSITEVTSKFLPDRKRDLPPTLASTANFNFHVVRRVAADGLIVGWTPPSETVAELCGYEVFVDGALRYRARSATRDLAYLSGLDLRHRHVLTLYALSCNAAFAHKSQSAFYEPESLYGAAPTKKRSSSKKRKKRSGSRGRKKRRSCECPPSGAAAAATTGAGKEQAKARADGGAVGAGASSIASDQHTESSSSALPTDEHH